MAFSVQGGQRGRSKYRRAPMSEINVTPMVDVMLVLLIVFMVAAPLLTVGVPVDLPKTQAAPLSEDKEPLTITIRSTGQIFLQETEVEADALVPRLEAIAQNGYEQRIFVRADSSIDYGRVMDVMGRINAAGYSKVGLVTDSVQPAAPAAKAPAR
ncbi:MAG TPA: protein TolR [Parvibaculum sp.]|uniref:protein TolR n=1 Tax=Parvibaculum sp. TaxID=2024848 RepID=UPI002CAACF53|nr:protein TolR [Parvibaculum sp.]HMM13064.1 protein TolR [Parvibaculum sp.]